MGSAASPVTCRRVALDSDEYRDCLRLREAILRAPLGLRITETDLALDRESLHFGAYEHGELRGCVSLKKLGSTQAKIRQMAVAPEHEGKAIGRALMDFAEEDARLAGIATIQLNARRTAEGFYARLGYVSEGEEFLEHTIPHIKMVKTI